MSAQILDLTYSILRDMTTYPQLADADVLDATARILDRGLRQHIPSLSQATRLVVLSDLPYRILKMKHEHTGEEIAFERFSMAIWNTLTVFEVEVAYMSDRDSLYYVHNRIRS